MAKTSKTTGKAASKTTETKPPEGGAPPEGAKDNGGEGGGAPKKDKPKKDKVPEGLVRLTRSEIDEYTGGPRSGPLTADVPDEQVPEWLAAQQGWRRDKVEE